MEVLKEIERERESEREKADTDYETNNNNVLSSLRAIYDIYSLTFSSSPLFLLAQMNVCTSKEIILTTSLRCYDVLRSLWLLCVCVYYENIEFYIFNLPIATLFLFLLLTSTILESIWGNSHTSCLFIYLVQMNFKCLYNLSTLFFPSLRWIGNIILKFVSKEITFRISIFVVLHFSSCFSSPSLHGAGRKRREKKNKN